MAIKTMRRRTPSTPAEQGHTITLVRITPTEELIAQADDGGVTARARGGRIRRTFSITADRQGDAVHAFSIPADCQIEVGGGEEGLFHPGDH